MIAKTKNARTLAALMMLSGVAFAEPTGCPEFVAEAKRRGVHRVELAPGTYYCHDAKGVVAEGLEDVVLDGRGATLVFVQGASKVVERGSRIVVSAETITDVKSE